MRCVNLKLYFVLIVGLAGISTSYSQPLELQGQLSGWTVVTKNKSIESQIGIRYIPALSLEKSFTNGLTIDSELSANAFGTRQFHSLEKSASGSKIKPYRLWLRFSSSQFEARLGLQKINFGSATFLRPLMWFDRIDPRDPLQLTDGVYGFLGRYYFLNNANIWLWGLYGNDETKGWEAIPSDKKMPEYGSRVQVPLFTGEIAVTYHHRNADFQNQDFAALISPKNQFPEDKFGLDGKWDIGIGLWFEVVFIHQDVVISMLRYQRLINLGLDFTFEFGNGLNIMGEYFSIATSEKALGAGEGMSFSAVSLNYPLDLLDNLTAMVYYDWENKNFYRFINFQRTLDNWSFYLIGFWNPDQFRIYQNQPEKNLFAGKGLQVMVVFNH